MRKCVLSLLVLSLCLGIVSSCNPDAQGPSSEAPELLEAVPSDVIAVGIFGDLDRGLDRMIDSTSVLLNVDYGKLARAKAVVAYCDLGALAPLVIMEAGKASADTLAAAASVLSQADTLGIPHAYVTLDNHNALLLSSSETVITVASRNLASETSILDAPGFDKVAPQIPGSDVTIYRNRGAARLFRGLFSGTMASSAVSFIRDASDWMLQTDEEIIPVQPEAEKYYANFCNSLQEAPVKLPAVLPAESLFLVDIPIASLDAYRHSYELWLDARVALEKYNRRLSEVWRKSGQDPRAWERDSDVKEVAVVTTPAGRINFVRVKDKAASDGISTNPQTGFVRALYGEIFADADSCMTRSGNWIISGSRAALESYEASGEGSRDWPSKAKVIAGSQSFRYIWNKDNRIKIWNSNR